ncbi:MAG TPA: hypothetical protein VK994_02930 [Bacteroidales bacterium]|nr:hypothetical protein [Bacteroidales bacterium]
MRIKLTILLYAILLYCTPALNAQEGKPYSIIDSVRYKLDLIHDYQADIEIEVDVEFINMPVKHARIFYKKPDKVKFESDEFLMLPRRGFDKQVTDILDEPFSAIYLGIETLNGKPHHVVRIVPLGKKPEVILATWWIDTASFQIARNESNLRKDGSFTVDFMYEDPGIILPTKMTFSIEIEKFSIPLKFIGKSQGMEIDKSRMKEDSQGKVYIRFSNYRINNNIPDDLFDEESSSKEE